MDTSSCAVRPGCASDADDALLSEQSDLVQVPRGHGWRFAAFGGSVIALVAVVAYVSSKQPGALVAGQLGATSSLDQLEEKVEQGACAAPGQNCLESGCCISGGAKGYQCYAKTEDWGECFDVGNCTAGVHEGETEGSWDETGTFQKAQWSCKEKGKSSKPACWSFTDAHCPSDRCEAIKKKGCVAKCGTLPNADVCWGDDHCMWESDKCQGACWQVEGKKSCTALSRCQWFDDPKGGRCSVACHVHGDQDCPGEEQCMVEKGQCKKDPCSAQWEDCRQTKCCSGSRGATGMTCFEKDASYATCLDIVDPKEQANWTGEKLGNRTKFTSGCSWAGEECSETHTCCNEGYNCAVKDETFSGCALNQKVTTWVKQHVDLPAGWEGTILGGWRGEYAIDPVGEGGDMAGVSMFCLMVVLPDSVEVELQAAAEKNGGSIFGCEAHKVYNSWKTDSASWDTAETTLINTAVFLKVFQWVRDDAEYLKHDWTVKVDPDCVFLPERLRNHLWGLRPPAKQAMYLKNNNVKGMGNNNFLGAIEVFSKLAVQIYLDNDEECGKYLGSNSGEDGFFKGCMDALGIGFMWDHEMFKPNYDPAICTNGKYAAYHPMKYATHWQRCWDIATGKICTDGEQYDCGGPLDPPISSAGIR